MRISDWSSDVCSSDLIPRGEDVHRQIEVADDARVEGLQLRHALGREGGVVLDLLAGQLHQVLVDDVADVLEVGGEVEDLHAAPALLRVQLLVVELRSEEHTSELQSLIRISYAVFCLENKNTP